MLKGKGFDSEKTILSILGPSDGGVSAPDLQLPAEPRPSKMNTSTPNGQPRPRPIVAATARPKGRPRINRETKKRYTFTILPSVYDGAAAKANSEGYSLSEVVSFLLSEYVRKE